MGSGVQIVFVVGARSVGPRSPASAVQPSDHTSRAADDFVFVDCQGLCDVGGGRAVEEQGDDRGVLRVDMGGCGCEQVACRQGD
jgi:hypothetical protein